MEEEGSTSSGGFVVIAAVVVFCMIAALLFMRYMVNQSKVKLIEQANERHKKIKEINGQENNNELVELKLKKGMDQLKGDSDENSRERAMDLQSGENIDEYQEQYNANHDFAIFHVGDKTVGGTMSL